LTLEPHQVVAVVGLLLAAVIDARTGKIPNVLNGVLLLAGVAWWVLDGRWVVGLAGAAAGFALHYPLWTLGVEKGGDAKLFIALGALVGWWEMLDTSAFTAILYFPVGLFILIVRGRLGNFVAGLRYTVKRAQGVPADQLEAPEPTMLRTGPIIAAAGIAALFWDILP
jgi:Flp pilus assembly protein protease CpaA